jgi:hypothetical protein
MSLSTSGACTQGRPLGQQRVRMQARRGVRGGAMLTEQPRVTNGDQAAIWLQMPACVRGPRLTIQCLQALSKVRGGNLNSLPGAGSDACCGALERHITCTRGQDPICSARVHCQNTQQVVVWCGRSHWGYQARCVCASCGHCPAGLERVHAWHWQRQRSRAGRPRARSRARGGVQGRGRARQEAGGRAAGRTGPSGRARALPGRRSERGAPGAPGSCRCPRPDRSVPLWEGRAGGV